MAHGRSLQLRNITRRPPTVLVAMFPSRRRRRHSEHYYGPANVTGPYRNPDRVERNRAKAATRRAARARRAAQGD